ncbi:MAG: hypothetical protein ACO3JG_02075 [Luteolibacter sp.]
MTHRLLNLEEGQRLIDIEVLMRGSGFLLGVFLAAAALYTVFHYRSVRRIPTKGRTLMALCHLLALAILILILAMPAAKVRYSKTYRPTLLVLVDTSRSMAVVDERTTTEALAEAARILGGLPFDQKVAEDAVRHQLAKRKDASRLELVKALFAHPQIDLLRRAGERFDVRFFSFDSGLAPEGGTEDGGQWLAAREANGAESRIGDALREAVGRYTGLPLAGAMVFSDFGWVNGEDPVRVAAEMQRSGVPVFTVPVGMPAPPDAMIAEVIAPEAVFHGDLVTLRVRVQSGGLDGKAGALKLKIDGVETQVEPLLLEDGTQFVELGIQPKQTTGNLQLDFELDGTAADSNPNNNMASQRLRIIEDKIKVLYVEGSPRWEFRYLRWVLMRNPHLTTRFLMTQGDPDLPKLSPYYMGGFPADVRNIFEYDLVILGDVSANYFKPGQLELLEEQIRENGGSLIMLAGSQSAPASYRDTPLERVLPVKIGVGKSTAVANDLYPRLPVDDTRSPITTLADDAEADQRIWARVRPLGQLPSLEGAKPGANVLLHLPGGAAGAPEYPVVSWQAYGKGKCMFVASDRLWRLRLEVGDAHHARFWGQSIQFLAMSRLLGQNKRISLQTERSRYNPGEPIRIYANVLSDAYEPVKKDSHTVVIARADAEVSAEEVVLVPDPATPGLYFGTHVAGRDGEYLLRGRDGETQITGTVGISVADDPLEDRDTAAKHEMAEAIAKASGGRVVAAGGLADWIDHLDAPEISRVVSREMELWDTPLLYLPLVFLLGLEWYLRRRENLL